MKTYTIRYKRTTIRLPFNPRKGICAACGKKGYTNMHHFKYAYDTKEVKENPLKALDFTLEVCFKCHQICNNLRRILEFIKDPSNIKIYDLLLQQGKKTIIEEE